MKNSLKKLAELISDYRTALLSAAIAAALSFPIGRLLEANDPQRFEVIHHGLNGVMLKKVDHYTGETWNYDYQSNTWVPILEKQGIAPTRQ